MFGRERVEYKTPDQIRHMRDAGLVVADALAATRQAAVPGASTADLDAIAAEVIAGAGALPSFLGYEGFPATVCVSVNDEVIHGIPGARRLRGGDIVSIDCGAIVAGWHADAAITVIVDEGDPRDVELSTVTEDAMWAGIAALAGASRVSEVGYAVEASVLAAQVMNGVQYGIVEDYVGHGIGSAMHQAPDVPNYRARERGPKVRPGMCLAIEPMLVRGESTTHVCEDDWTVVTSDGRRAAHWEHTVAILDGGLHVLTAHDGGAERLAALGVQIHPV